MVRSLAVTALGLLLGCTVALGQGASKAAYKGGFLVSGQAGASLAFYDAGEIDATATRLDISLAPRALYFLMDGLGVGIEVGYDYYSYRASGNQVTRVAYYLVQTSTRYPRACCLTPYFGPGWWMPFVGLTGQYVVPNGTLATNGWRARAGVGLSPLIGDRGTMPVEVGYEMQSYKFGGATANSSRVYLEVGFGAFLFK
jgi:hypothetical protein